MSNAIMQFLHPEGVLLNCEFTTAEEAIKAIRKQTIRSRFCQSKFRLYGNRTGEIPSFWFATAEFRQPPLTTQKCE